MRQKILSTKHMIRFRRWNRKAYATFASIGRCITIGQLRKGAADSSQAKQKKPSVFIYHLEKNRNTQRGFTSEWQTDQASPYINIKQKHFSENKNIVQQTKSRRLSMTPSFSLYLGVHYADCKNFKQDLRISAQWAPKLHLPNNKMKNKKK